MPMMREDKIRKWRDEVEKDIKVYTGKEDTESAERAWAILRVLKCVLGEEVR